MSNDLKFAIRGMLRSPGFSSVVILTLALGIGSTAAVYTVVNHVLLNAEPFPDSGRIIQVTRTTPDDTNDWTSFFKYSYWVAHQNTFESLGVCAIMPSGLALTGRSDPEFVQNLPVSQSFFKVLGVSPAIGAEFSANDDKAGAAKVVLLSYGLWVRRYASDPGVIGRPVTLGGDAYTIKGVMPASFDFSLHADLWTPIAASPDATDKTNRFLVFGRLRPNTSVGDGEADLKAADRAFGRDYPALLSQGESLRLTTLPTKTAEPVRPGLLILSIAVLFVFLISCTNLVNLFLSRSLARMPEFGVRTAVGATVGSLARQLLVETVVLALIGCAAGIMVAYSLLWALRRAAPPDLLAVSALKMDGASWLFALVSAAVAAILIAAIPVFYVTRRGLLSTAPRTSNRATTGASGMRLRSVFIVSEVALSFALLIGAGLLISGFLNLIQTQPGFNAASVTTVKMSTAGPEFGSTEKVTAFTRKVVSHLEARPGISAAASVTTLPTETGPDMPFDIPGRTLPRDVDNSAQWRSVSVHYFQVLQIPLLRGRYLSESDNSHGKPVMLINQSLAKRFWPDGNAIGQHLVIGRPMGPMFADQPREIVGIVGDARELGLDKPAPAIMYIPVYQVPDAISNIFAEGIPTSWVIRSHLGTKELQALTKQDVLSVDPNEPITAVQSLETVLANSFAQRRFTMQLLLGFAVVALMLTAVGIYGVMAYTVTLRDREFGIRLALGARNSKIFTLVLRDVLWVVGIGLLLGAALSLALATVLRSVLFGVGAYDPATLLLIPGILLLVALAAGFVPAIRAARSNPVDLLKPI